MKYGPPESLSLFMFQQPKRAKRLYFDVIPKNTDEYISFRSKVLLEEKDRKLENPAWHIHNGEIPQDKIPLNFSLLLNLASVCHAEDASVIWGYIRSYANDTSPENNMFLDKLANYAVNFYRDFVKPTKTYRFPDSQEAKALEDLKGALKQINSSSKAEDIQTVIYEIGKANEFENLRNWFQALYQILLGQDQGPRFGSFVELYGIQETDNLIERALNKEDLSK